MLFINSEQEKKNKEIIFFDRQEIFDLESISLCDYNSKKIRLHTLCCTFGSLNKEEQQCDLDLTNVNKGNYYIYEHYWGYSDYFKKIKARNYFKIIIE